MYYVDSQRTLTRRESSLITSRRSDGQDFETLSTARNPSIAPFASESGTSLMVRPRGSVQKEIVTMMFESMLGSIVDSWEVLVAQKSEDITVSGKTARSTSELTLSGKKKKNNVKSTKGNRRSKLELNEGNQISPLQLSWWFSPDERAVVRFRNGNVYEGSISMKCMHGEGRFQWADGTVYLGQFKDNQIFGKGFIQWKDDTWYQGDFVGNIRHGKGLYVDSRKQRSYAGGWHCGTKHGQGVIYYSETFKNSYDGDWEYNVRHGFGSREYCDQSGYKGEWDQYLREGNGVMIWPNHDFYKGQWKNGVMSGQGIYIWDAYYNNSLSLPSIIAYRGQWLKGQRNGYGVLNLGYGLGSYYKGEFKDNKKHGVGKFVSNDGLILYNKNLFIDDNISSLTDEDQLSDSSPERKRMALEEPYKFDLCDNTFGYICHVQAAIKNIDKQSEIRNNIINNYLLNNKMMLDNSYNIHQEIQECENHSNVNLEDVINFEEVSLRKSLRCYETELKRIYFTYATICNNDDIQFTPVLIRLFLWQMYYDCNVHEKGLTLVEIDRMFHSNPQWLSKSPHNPFQKIYFWQFLHSLITVASKLYAKRELPGPKPDTILANAFRSFMESDILPNVGNRKGRLVNGFGQYIPLKGLYKLYRSIGEPHTIRDFLQEIRRSPHNTDQPPQPPLVEANDDCLPLGQNVYVFGDSLTFVANEAVPADSEQFDKEGIYDLKLFNFGNLSSRKVIKIFGNIFPWLYKNNKIMSIDMEITFLEFFEAFIVCAEESIKIKDEEIQWREKFSTI